MTILWLLGHVAWTQHDQCFELELEYYVVIRYVYKFRVRLRFVVAILLHKYHYY
jgi:hypothetical protein